MKTKTNTALFYIIPVYGQSDVVAENPIRKISSLFLPRCVYKNFVSNSLNLLLLLFVQSVKVEISNDNKRFDCSLRNERLSLMSLLIIYEKDFLAKLNSLEKLVSKEIY
jgi:hypothetical protein